MDTFCCLLFADAPACQTELSGTDPVIIAASRSEIVNITCEMDALPDNLNFHWTHTNTVGETTVIVPEIYSSQGSRSLLRYHLLKEDDFGTLLCWASNSIGNAERPCVYQLVPAGWTLLLDFLFPHIKYIILTVCLAVSYSYIPFQTYSFTF